MKTVIIAILYWLSAIVIMAFALAVLWVVVFIAFESGKDKTQKVAQPLDDSVLYQLDNDWVILRDGARFDQQSDPVMFYAKARNVQTGEEIDLEVEVSDSIRLVVEHLAERKIAKMAKTDQD